MKRIFASVLCLLACAALFMGCAKQPAKVVGEYSDVGELSLGFEPEGAYAIGADKNGMPVFYDPEAALEQAREDFSAGFSYLQETYVLDDPGPDSYQGYKIYGAQMTGEATEEERADGLAIAKFFDIYENSYQ